jgi:hypothetical protein
MALYYSGWDFVGWMIAVCEEISVEEVILEAVNSPELPVIFPRHRHSILVY